MEYNHETAEFYSKKEPGFLEIRIKKQIEKNLPKKDL
jgi:hypothetical protein